VKTLKKTQINVNDYVIPTEILNLIKVNQATKEVNSAKCLVHLHEVFEDDEYVHLVMDYCSGGSLM